MAREDTAVSPEEAGIVLLSWKRLAASGERAAALFYDRLFDIAPETRGRLGMDQMPAYRRGMLDGMDWALAELFGPRRPPPPRQPGPARPAVPPPAPPPVPGRDPFLGVGGGAALEALVWTFEKVLGGAWTPREAAAWAEAGPAVIAALRPPPAIRP